MAIAFPSITPDAQQFGIKYNTQISVSDISGVAQTIELPGARWRGALTFTDMTPSEAALLQVFILTLRGSAASFLYGDQSRTSPQTSVTGSLTVESGSTNRLIYTTPATGGFSVGDYIQIGADGDSPELKMIIGVAGGPGQQALTIEPLMRRTDFLGKTVIYTNPKTQFRLLNEDQLQWGIRSKALLTDINLEFIEFF